MVSTHPHPVGVTPFTVSVMGGSFVVSSVVPRDSRSVEEMVHSIHTTPADRWFVMLSEELEDAASADSLALIDDTFEFQVYALGTFKGDD